MDNNTFTMMFIAILLLIALSFSSTEIISSEIPGNPAVPDYLVTGSAVLKTPEWTTVKDQLSTKVDNDLLFVKVENEFVYKYGYIYTKYGQEVFELQGPQIEDSSWISQKGEVTLELKKYQLVPGKNYVIVYTCKKEGDAFDCNGFKWLIGGFIYPGEAEKTPEELCLMTGGKWLSLFGQPLKIDSCKCQDGWYFDINRGCLETFDCVKEGGSKPQLKAPPCCDNIAEIRCEKPDPATGECNQIFIECSICANCGDKICGPGENKCNCPTDCIEVCPTVYDPVCGEDGSTYSNECIALVADVRVAYGGRCCTACGGELFNPCGKTECLSLGADNCEYKPIIGSFYGKCTAKLG